MRFNDNGQLKEYLKAISSEKLREFNAGIIPTGKPSFGVPIPTLRDIAKDSAREDLFGFLGVLSQDTFEEIMLFGMAVGYADIPLRDRIRLIDKFLSFADNWAHIDCALTTYKFIAKNREEFIPVIESCLSSGGEYRMRFALVALLYYYVEEKYLPYIFETAESVDCTQRYVSMAAAWLISVCYVKFPDPTDEFLRETEIDDRTYNMALQKILDSNRLDEETKIYIKSLKRKK